MNQSSAFVFLVWSLAFLPYFQVSARVIDLSGANSASQNQFGSELEKQPSQVTRLDIESLDKKATLLKHTFESSDTDTGLKAFTATDGPIAKPFEITVDCQATTELCNKANLAMEAATSKIALMLRINTPITIKATIRSFCSGASQTTTCSLADTLGQAASASFFNGKADNQENYYLYPQALVKQLKLNKNLQFSEYDIISEFNVSIVAVFIDICSLLKSDFDFWYPGDAAIGEKQTSFEFVFAHELTHGLGFDTRWIQWSGIISEAPFDVPSDFLAPFFTTTADPGVSTENLVVKSWEPLQIYDAFTYQTSTNKNMIDYANQIYSFVPNGKTVIQFIEQFFKSSSPFDAASQVFDIVSGGTGKLGFRPSSSSIGKNATANGVTQIYNVLLSTSSTYLSGTSIAHLDYNTYVGSPDFLMIPAVQDLRGRTLDDIILNNSDPTSYKGIYGPRTLQILGSLGWPTLLNEGVESLDIQDEIKINVKSGASTPRMSASYLMASLIPFIYLL